MRSAEIARNIQRGEVDESDIHDLIQGVVSRDGGRWPDEEVVMVLKSIFEHGLESENTGRLTLGMMQSGEILTWPEEWKHLVVDKHSTGGVGDKVSIPLAPALAAFCAKAAIMAVTLAVFCATAPTFPEAAAQWRMCPHLAFTLSNCLPHPQTNLGSLAVGVSGVEAGLSPEHCSRRVRWMHVARQWHCGGQARASSC